MAILTRQWSIDSNVNNKLSITTKQLPEIASNQVLIKVHAVSLNYRDKLEIENFDPAKIRHPYALASDMAGEIIAIGSGVTQFAIGDKVINSFFNEWFDGNFHGKIDHTIGTFGSSKVDGVLSEYIVVAVDCLVKAPKNLSYIESSTLTCAAVTAWEALIEQGHLKAGDTVVIQGTGGVAVFALQFALAHGANCIMISSDDGKLDQLKKLGNFQRINRSITPEWHLEVSKLTDNYGANHILELVSGSNLNRSVSAVSFHGNIYLIGVLEGFETSINIHPLLFKKPKLHGIGVGSRQTLQNVVTAIETLDLKPWIDHVYAFDEVPIAFEHLKHGAVGKIVISVSK